MLRKSGETNSTNLCWKLKSPKVFLVVKAWQSQIIFAAPDITFQLWPKEVPAPWRIVATICRGELLNITAALMSVYILDIYRLFLRFVQQSTLKILHSFYFKLQSSIIIAYKDGSWMLLKRRNSPHVVHPFFNCFV